MFIKQVNEYYKCIIITIIIYIIINVIFINLNKLMNIINAGTLLNWNLNQEFS